MHGGALVIFLQSRNVWGTGLGIMAVANEHGIKLIGMFIT
jgi:hypothetical protein